MKGRSAVAVSNVKMNIPFPPLLWYRHSQDSSLKQGDDYDYFLLLLQRSPVFGSSVRLSRTTMVTTMACPIVADSTK